MGSGEESAEIVESPLERASKRASPRSSESMSERGEPVPGESECTISCVGRGEDSVNECVLQFTAAADCPTVERVFSTALLSAKLCSKAESGQPLSDAVSNSIGQPSSAAVEMPGSRSGGSGGQRCWSVSAHELITCTGYPLSSKAQASRRLPDT